jgi:mono/diheme cytochrome c family protein
MKTSLASLAAVLGLACLAAPAEATDPMQKQAKKLGFPVKNCLYCHATPHSEQVMQDRAKQFKVPAGNCLVCHGNDIPGTLNDRGHWLVEQKTKRGAKEADMAWLKDYVEKPAKK